MDAVTFFRRILDQYEVFGPKIFDRATFVRKIEAHFGPDMVARLLDLNVDSGATDHMMRSSDFLCNLRPPPDQVLVEVADGNKVSVAAIGDLVTEYIKLPGVYVVPDLKKNLLSVHQLARDNGILTILGKNSAELIMGGERIGGAIVEDGLYKVRFVLAPPGHAAPHTSPAAPGEHISSVANAASSHFKDLVASLKDKKSDWVTILKANWATSLEKAKEADWVTSPEDPAVLVDSWVESFKDKYMIGGDWFDPTAKMDESDGIGGAAVCNMIRDGSFVPGKAHLGSEGTACMVPTL